jgi:kynurenine formamidase
MSIWSSIGIDEPDDVTALRNETEAANYRGEGTDDVWIGIATTWHHRARLSIMLQDPSPGIDDEIAEVLIDPANVRRLIDYLQRALPLIEKYDQRREGTAD